MILAQVAGYSIGLLLLTLFSIAAGVAWEGRAWEVAVRADLLESWPDGSDER